LRSYLATHANVKPVRDFPLLRLLGADLPGALIMRDYDAVHEPPVDGVKIEGGAYVTGDHELLRFSLAGVQLKFSATGSPQRGLTIPAGGRGGDWIVKLPEQRFLRVPENEYSMMTFARAIGIDVPEIGLVDPSSVRGLPSDIRGLSGQAFYISRFDRTNDGGRVHTEDFAQLNALYPEQKYQRLSFDMLAEQVGDLVGSDATLDLIRRIVFTVGIGNGDMHSKNWSIIYRDGRTPQLAPAYDYVSTVAYLPADDMGLNLAGTKQFTDVDDERLTSLAYHARLPRKAVLDAAHDTVDRMREVWPQIRDTLPLIDEHRAAVSAHMAALPLFAARTALARP
jgi:serine/threonine-protein kinase HipA